MEPRNGSKMVSSLHNKDTDWTAFTGKVKEKIMEVKRHKRWKGTRSHIDNHSKIRKDNSLKESWKWRPRKIRK
jgi:hypothetical protein